MKNREQLPEPLVPGQENTETYLNDLQDQALLVIVDIDKMQITYLNKMLKVFCGLEEEVFVKDQNDLYREIIHPGDYPRYMEHLLAFKDLPTTGTKEIDIRIKNSPGSYSSFRFRDRRYNWSPDGQKNLVLSQAWKTKAKSYLESKDPFWDTPRELDLPATKYHHLLNSIDEAYCIIELIFDQKENPVDYLILETNPAFEKQVNLKDVTGQTMREIVPNHEDFWFQKFGKIALTGESLRFEGYGEYLDKDWFDLYAFKTGGELSRRVTVLFHNITQRKNAEEELKKRKDELKVKVEQRQHELDENTQLLQTVFDNTDLAIAVFETMYYENQEIKDFRFVQVNKVLRELYLDKDVIGSTYSEISQYGVQLDIFDGFKKVMETGTVLDQELFFDKQGYNNWFRIIARKQNHLLIVSIEDISNRKEEAQQLKEAMRFNRQLVQTSPNTILIINLDQFKVRYINQDLLARAGMTKDIIMGMSLPQILHYLHPRDREKIMNFHRKILKSSEEEILETELRIKTKGSEWEWFSARGKIFDRRDESWVKEYVLVVQNISEEKQTQRALIQAEKLSIQGDVARTLAHELRNPLASIRMATDVLKHKLETPQKETLASYMDILTRSTQVLNGLVSNLLNASNYSPALLEKVNLAECVDYSLEQAADRIYLTGIKVIRNYKGPYIILADKEKLNIALLNIIVNASEATNPNEGIIEISIKPHKTDFVLSIKDNGHGLEQEQIDKLFDAFYTNKASGAGIGLTSVKNILDDHDAQIKVISKPNQGTTFKIFLHNIEHV